MARSGGQLAPLAVNKLLLLLFLQFNLIISRTYPTVFVWRVAYDASLTSYWPMNGTANEMIADRHFVCNNISAALFVVDRDGNAAQAVRVNTNWSNFYRAPTAVYFAGDFSFSGWFRVNSFVSWARFVGKLNFHLIFKQVYWKRVQISTYGILIQHFFQNFYHFLCIISLYQDFGLGEASDNFDVSMAYNANNVVYEEKFSNYSGVSILGSNISLLTWNHVAYTQTGSTGIIYTNGGSPVTRTNMPIFRNVNRTSNLLGNTNLPAYPPTDFDEVKIWNRALSAAEVLADRNYNRSYIYTLWIVRYS
jgi:hypothetical protein